MKLPAFLKPKEEKSTRSPKGLLIGLGVAVILIGFSSSVVLSEFPWTGNPIAWLNAREAYEQGNTARQKYLMEDATTKYQAAIGLFLSDWRFHNSLGLSYASRDPKAAEKSFREALRLKPNNFEPQMNLAECLTQQPGRADEAEAAAKAAIQIEPRNAEALAQLALILQSHRKPEEAEKVLQKAGSMEKDTGKYWYLVGKYHIQSGDLQRAEADLRQATELEKTNPEYWEVLGYLVSKKNDFENAELFLRRACRLNSHNAVYWKNLGDICRQLNRIPQAEDAYRRASSNNPKNAEYWLLLGLTIFAQERFSDAEYPLKQALDLDPNDNVKWNAYINCLENQKKYSQAAEMLAKYLSIPGKENVKTLAFLGGVLTEAREYSKALVAFNKAKSMTKDKATIDDIDAKIKEMNARKQGAAARK